MAQKAVRFTPEVTEVLSVEHAIRLAHPTIRRKGGSFRWRVDAAVVAVIGRLRDELGMGIPSNANTYAGTWGLPHYQQLPASVAESQARFCGWWRLVLDRPKEISLLVRLGCRTSSSNGYNSPANTFPLFELPKRFSSPHKAERWLKAVIRRSDKILAPWGQRTSWETLALVAGGNARSNGWHTVSATSLRPHKAGMAAAAVTLSAQAGRLNIQPTSYRPRDVLTACAGIRRTSVDEVNGVVGPPTVVDGHVCRMFATTDGRNHNNGILVRRGRRTYHCQRNWGGYGWNRETMYQAAIAEAKAAWTKQVHHRRYGDATTQLRRKVQALPHDARTTLVRVSDSVRAGNCPAGTQAWMDRAGLRGRWAVDVRELLPHIEDEAVRRVIAARLGLTT